MIPADHMAATFFPAQKSGSPAQAGALGKERAAPSGNGLPEFIESLIENLQTGINADNPSSPAPVPQNLKDNLDLLHKLLRENFAGELPEEYVEGEFDREALLNALLEASGMKLENTGTDADTKQPSPKPGAHGQLNAVLAQLLAQMQTASQQQSSPVSTDMHGQNLPPASQSPAFPAFQALAADAGLDAELTEKIPHAVPGQKTKAQISAQTQSQPVQIPQQQSSPAPQAQNTGSGQQMVQHTPAPPPPALNFDGSFFSGEGFNGDFHQHNAGQYTIDGQNGAQHGVKTGQNPALSTMVAAKAAGSFQSPASHRIMLNIQRGASEHIRQMTLHLEPALMGRVAVTMNFGKNGLMKAHLLVEKPDTYNLLQKDAQALEKALKEAGLDLEENALSFDLAAGENPFEQAENEKEGGKDFLLHLPAEDGAEDLPDPLLAAQQSANENGYILRDKVNILI
ncbi:MAG: hypothetical protein EA357_01205 [Micavibrio sp.]|nr:MAG: hypothetical protein EA357_01205 [Micavibrio sp.]